MLYKTTAISKFLEDEMRQARSFNPDVIKDVAGRWQQIKYCGLEHSGEWKKSKFSKLSHTSSETLSVPVEETSLTSRKTSRGCDGAG